MRLLDRVLAAVTPARTGVGSQGPGAGEEVGVTGTPILGGFLRDLGEYNAELEGLAAFRTYEKMRRSDAQVAATIAAMKLPIRSADWTVKPPEDATPVEKEAADFVRECLFEGVDFDAVIENALLMLDFGVAAHEDVWMIDGSRVRLKKLAARLPVTFYRWIVADQGEELLAIEQQGYGGGQYRTVQVPADKLAIFTFQQEGANFAGRSILRAMYQHWYIKAALYKIDAIAIERNGMGVPWIEMGPDSKAEDRKTAIAWLEKLSVHEKAALLLPPAWKFGLKGVEGSTRDPKESIAHHNAMISMAGLQMFMQLGQTESGNRALGETMTGFFYLGLQATAKRIARAMNQTTIRRLVEFNFEGARPPALEAQNVQSVGFDNLVSALKELANAGVDAIRPDDEIEDWMRKKMGAPARGTPRVRQISGVIERGGGQPGGGQGPEAGGQGKSSQGGKEGTSPAGIKAGEGGAGCPTRLSSSPGSKSPSGGPLLRREPQGAERFLALAEIASELDRGRDEIAAALRRARQRVQAEIVNKLVNAPVRTMHRISVAPDEKLVAEIEGILGGVYEFGYGQVGREREAQRAGREPADAASVRMAERRAKRDPLGVYADASVSEFTNNLTQRAANVVLDLMRRAGERTKGEVITEAEDRLDEQSDAWIDGVSAKATNNAFADGRRDGYDEYKDEIREVQYSALLDVNTCEACAGADGEVGETPDDIPAAPNPDCDGGDRCRCVHVFVFEGEGRIAA